MDSTRTTPPSHIAHYQLLETIGRGGMGLVYRARDTRLERDVAIKCLRTELFAAHYIERFKREALLLAKLNHPNIVQIYDFIDAPEQLALVMELVDGQNLQHYLREHIVPLRQRVQWLTQIAEGLAVAHDSGIIHRDLKAENILINKRGQAKITDLGIAKSQDFNATLTDHIAGSYCSMSPEQAMGETLDFKSDLFSLGILAYQLLCGAHPFGDTGNKLQIMQRIIAHPPTPPHQHNPDLPAGFVVLLGQLLCKDPHKRPDNSHWVAAQFAQLSQLLNSTPVSDDTQLLAPQLSANPANQTFSNTHSAQPKHTQDHPTFETRFIASGAAIPLSPRQRFKHWLAQNKISAGLGLLTLVILAGVGIWQLQPRAPKYVAVIPPKLTAEGMQEAQQELVKGAVYDAIQQSVIQLEGYYLIPRSEIADVRGDNETVRRATAADELISTEIHCKIESCVITFTRLAAAKAIDRLRVEDVKKVDILTDNYLSIAGTTQTNIGNLFDNSLTNSFSQISEIDYRKFLEINHAYISNGASIALLDKLDLLGKNIKNMAAIQSLYTEIGLDIHHEVQSPAIIERIENHLTIGTTKNDRLAYFHNIFYLAVAKQDFEGANNAIENLKTIDSNQSSLNELYGYYMIARHDYAAASEYYKKSLNVKKSSSTILSLANSYLHAGNLTLSKQHAEEAIHFSHDNYKALSLLGVIALLEGNIAASAKLLESALEKNPTDFNNLISLGLCYLLQHEYNKAIKAFTSAELISPSNTAALLNKADAYNLSGDTENAKKYYQAVINAVLASSTSEEEHIRLAQAYAHLGNIHEALFSLRTLEKNYAQNIEVAYTSALVHSLANNKSAAVFNAELSIKNGMHPLWFNFSWFDTLCTEQSFIMLMNNLGSMNRCPQNH